MFQEKAKSAASRERWKFSETVKRGASEACRTASGEREERSIKSVLGLSIASKALYKFHGQVRWLASRMFHRRPRGQHQERPGVKSVASRVLWQATENRKNVATRASWNSTVAEVQRRLTFATVRRAARDQVPPDRLVRMRRALTYKEAGQPKGRTCLHWM